MPRRQRREKPLQRDQPPLFEQNGLASIFIRNIVYGSWRRSLPSLELALPVELIVGCALFAKIGHRLCRGCHHEPFSGCANNAQIRATPPSTNSSIRVTYPCSFGVDLIFRCSFIYSRCKAMRTHERCTQICDGATQRPEQSRIQNIQNVRIIRVLDVFSWFLTDCEDDLVTTYRQLSEYRLWLDNPCPDLSARSSGEAFAMKSARTASSSVSRDIAISLSYPTRSCRFRSSD